MISGLKVETYKPQNKIENVENTKMTKCDEMLTASSASELRAAVSSASELKTVVSKVFELRAEILSHLNVYHFNRLAERLCGGA